MRSERKEEVREGEWEGDKSGCEGGRECSAGGRRGMDGRNEVVKELEDLRRKERRREGREGNANG